MKRLLLLFPMVISAQVQTIPNTQFPAVRALLNSNFSWLNTNKAGIGGCAGGSFSVQTTTVGVVCLQVNWNVLAGVPSTFTPPAPGVSTLGGVRALTCSGTEKLSGIGTDGIPVCSADQTGSPGSGITDFNGLNVTSQSFAKTDDTNVTLSITSLGSAHTFALGWTGALAKARQHANTVYTDGSYSDPVWLTLTKGKVGLGNVDNTSDAAKPISTLTQAALDAKAPLASPTFTGTVSGITRAMVGLPNVDNTSDVSKPVSTAQQAALDLKANLASPALSGVPTVPTAAADTNTTQAASAAFVLGQAGAASPPMNGIVSAGTSPRYSRQDHIHPVDTSRAASNASTTVNGQTCALGSTCTITAAPSGSDTQVAFNDGGAMAGDAGMTYNKTTDSLTLAGSLTAGAGGSGAGYLQIGQGTPPSAGTTAVTLAAPASVTSYINLLPGAASSGFYYGLNSSGTVTWSQVSDTGTGNVVRATSAVLTTPNLGTPSAIVLTNATGFPTLNQSTTGTAGGLTGTALGGDVTNSGNTVTLAAKYKTRVCEVHIWGSGASQVLQDADDEPASCFNGFGVTETVTNVRCWTNAGSPTVTPVITDGGGAILTGALTCTNTSTAPMGAAGTLSGTPTLASTGTINANVTTAGGVATNIRIFITLTR